MDGRAYCPLPWSEGLHSVQPVLLMTYANNFAAKFVSHLGNFSFGFADRHRLVHTFAKALLARRATLPLRGPEKLDDFRIQSKHA